VEVTEVSQPCLDRTISTYRTVFSPELRLTQEHLTSNGTLHERSMLSLYAHKISALRKVSPTRQPRLSLNVLFARLSRMRNVTQIKSTPHLTCDIT